MSIGLFLALLIGYLLMCITIGQQLKWYKISWKKAPAVSLAVILDGLIGSALWFYLENHTFGGRSLYGAIFFVPVFFWPISRYLKVPYTHGMDFAAPSACLTLSLVKIQCLRENCCQGKFLYIDEDHMYVFFPSQIVEMITFFILAFVLLFLSKKESNHGRIYPLGLVLYGGSRFILNFFRGELTPYMLGLSAGSFWSACAFIIGLIWLCIARGNKCFRAREIATQRTN